MQTPVILLSGFLGSGKTTLLLSLIKESKRRGLRPGILMNELGMRDVDGYILEEQADVQVEKLLDGCVCCSRKNDLPDSLLQLLQQQPDVIYIELTGVADPDEIIRALLEPDLHKLLQLHHTVTLLDAENALEFNSRLSADKQLVRTLHKQLETADLIAVNKSDLVDADTLGRIEKIIRKHNRHADIVNTNYGRIDLSMLLKGLSTKQVHAPTVRSISAAFHEDLGHTHKHERSQTTPPGSFSKVKTVTLTFPQGISTHAFSREDMEDFFQHWGDRLLRAKGHVVCGSGIELVQYAGGRASWEPSRYPGSPYIVCIGLDLNETLLKEQWSALFP